jgi:dGTPase
MTIPRLTRRDLEAREAESLAPYACRSAESAGRAHPESEPEYRTAYQRDRDRVLHCRAFRRLQYKTQVFVNHEGDYYRTRLTHSTAVAGVARTMARALALNEDLAEAVALAHDLGHPPFGHAGEETLDSLMSARGGFSHNAHSLRVVDELEDPFPRFRGLNLTAEVRECLAAKHRQRRAAEPDLFSYQDPVAGRGDLRPPLEGQLVDLADSIAYDHHDLEDGLTAGMIRPEDLDGLELWRRAGEEVAARYGPLPEKHRVRRTVSAVIELMVSDAMDETRRRIVSLGLRSPADARSAPRPAVRFGEGMAAAVAGLEQFLFARLYRHHRVVRMNAKARRMMRTLFETYLAEPGQLPPHALERSDTDGLHRRVCDYIAGMTDRFCQEEYKKLFEPFERV